MVVLDLVADEGGVEWVGYVFVHRPAKALSVGCQRNLLSAALQVPEDVTGLEAMLMLRKARRGFEYEDEGRERFFLSAIAMAGQKFNQVASLVFRAVFPVKSLGSSAAVNTREQLWVPRSLLVKYLSII
jgi:hypothetical protein